MHIDISVDISVEIYVDGTDVSFCVIRFRFRKKTTPEYRDFVIQRSLKIKRSGKRQTRVVCVCVCGGGGAVPAVTRGMKIVLISLGIKFFAFFF